MDPKSTSCTSWVEVIRSLSRDYKYPTPFYCAQTGKIPGVSCLLCMTWRGVPVRLLYLQRL